MAKGKEATTVPVTAEQRQGFSDARRAIDDHVRGGGRFDSTNANHRLFLVAFDGTGKTDEDENVSNVVKLEQLVRDADGSGVETSYEEGVGTAGPIDQYVTGGPFGEGSIGRANDAYEELVKQTKAWHAENPDVEIHLSTVSFSRGSGSQRHFLNKVYDEGVPAEGATRIVTDEIIGWTGRGGRASDPVYRVVYDEYLIAPGEIRVDAVLIHDSVVTGQTGRLDMGMPPIADMNVLHLTANHEFRDQFELSSIVDPDHPDDPRLLEIGLSGAHSDIGGGYGDNGIEALTLELGHAYLRQMGVPISDISANWRPTGEPRIHDSVNGIYTDIDNSRDVYYYRNPPLPSDRQVSGPDGEIRGWQFALDLDFHLEIEGGRPFTATGELDPAYVARFDNPETYQQFLDSLDGSALASAGDPAAQRQAHDQAYQAFVRDKALEQAARDSGRDFAELKGLNVPGNPNAPGYHWQPDDGDIDLALYRELEKRQALWEGVEALGNVYYGLKGGDEALAVLGGLGLAVQADRFLDAGSGGFLGEEAERGLTGALDAGASAYRFYESLRHGDDGQRVMSGLELARQIEGLGSVDLGRLGEWAGSPGSGAALAAYGLYEALDGGDVGGALMSGLALADSLGATVPGAPYVGYLRAAVSLLEGDVEAVALQATSAYLMTLGPYGWVAAAVLSVFGGGLFDDEPPDPEAWLEFVVGEDGGVGYRTGSNETGQGLEEVLEGSGEGFANYLERLDQAYAPILADGQIELDALPQIRLYQEYGEDNFEWRFVGGRGIPGQVINGVGPTPSSGELLEYLAHMVLVTHIQESWVVHRDANQVIYDPFGLLAGIAPSVVQAVGVGPVLVRPQTSGYVGPTVAKDSDIRSLGSGAIPPAVKTVEDVSRTWRVERELFAGRGGGLLALGLGAGLVSHEAIAANVTGRAPQSVFQHPDTAGLLAGADTVIVAGRGLVTETDDVPTAGRGTAGEPWLEREVSEAWLPGYGAKTTDDSAGDRSPMVLVNGRPVSVGGAGHTGSGDGTASPAQDPSSSGNDVFVNAEAMALWIRSLESGAGTGNGATGDRGMVPGRTPGRTSAAGRESAADVPGTGDTGGGDGGSGPGDTGLPPGTDLLWMVEDRYLLTDPARLLANDGEGAVFLGLVGARHGTVVRLDNGDIRFTPDPDYSGSAGFRYHLQTADGGYRSHEVIVDVAGANDTPDAVDDRLVPVGPGPIRLDRLLANDTDIDGDALRIVAVGQPTHGSVRPGPNGFEYLPSPGHAGPVSLLYVVEDTSGARSVARADFEPDMTANRPPVTAELLLEGAVEEQPYVFGEDDLLGAARDPEGRPLTLVSVAVLEGGATDRDAAGGTITFVPDPDFHGIARLAYEVADDHGAVGAGTAGIVVANVPDPLVSASARFEVPEDGVIRFEPDALLAALAVENADGGPLTVSAARMVDGMAGRVYWLPDGSVEWLPPAGYSGPSAFEVRIDNGVERTIARVDLEVNAANDAPLAAADRIEGAVEDRSHTFAAADLLANDSDEEGDAFHLESVAVADPAQGRVAYDPENGLITVTPAADFHGGLEFVYTLVENHSGQTSQGSATVMVAAVDDPPHISDKTFTIAEDSVTVFTADTLLDRPFDSDGEPIVITGVDLRDSGSGTVALLADGAVRYTPASEYAGHSELILDYSDGVTSHAARVAVTVVGHNDAPVGGSHRFAAVEDQPFRLAVDELLAGAADAEGDAVFVAGLRLVGGAPGRLEWDRPSGYAIITPDADFHGPLTVEYTLEDSRGGRASYRAEIDFGPVEDDFLVGNRRFELAEDQARVFQPSDLLDSTSDADGQPLVIDRVRLTVPESGRIELLEGGAIRFVPAAEFSGDTAIEYEVTDGAHRHGARADIVVHAEDDLPAAVSDLLHGVEDNLLVFHQDDLTGNDFDAEGDGFRFTGIRALDDHDTVVWDPLSGVIEYRPAPDFFGNARLVYALTDDGGRTSEGEVTVAVAGVNDVPQIEDRGMKDPAFNLVEEEVVIFPSTVLLGGTRDADGEELVIRAARMVDDRLGTVQVTSHGDVRFEPAADITGEVSFIITVDDGVEPVEATMTVHLWPVNDRPRTVDDARAMEEEGVIAVTGTELLANDDDVDGTHGELRLVGVWASSGGVARYDAATDRIAFEAQTDFFGTGWVDYLVEDAEGAWSVARLDITVRNVDDPAVAVDDTVVMVEDQPAFIPVADLVANDHNPDREVLRVAAVDDGGLAHGRLTFTGDGILLVPEDDYFGEQSFGYTIIDESGHASSATATVVVQEVNDPPIVAPVVIGGTEDTPVVLSVDDLLANARDIEDDWMQVAGVRSADGMVSYDVGAGEIWLDPLPHLNSAINGGPLLLEYQVVDERGGAAWGTVGIDLAAVNDLPVAADDVLLVWESGSGAYVNPVAGSWLLVNDLEFDGEPMRIDAVGAPAHGNLTFDPDSQFILYRAASGFVGTDEFSYRVVDDAIHVDGTISADQATVRVKVLDNRAPVAHDFATLAAEDTILRFDTADFMDHVDDPDLELLEMPERHRVVAVANALNGQVTLEADGTVRFEPIDHYNSVEHGGVAGFDYVVEDIVGNRSGGSVSITYTPVNDAPVAVGEALGTIDEDSAGLQFSGRQLLLNDWDIEGDPVTLLDVVSGNGGVVHRVGADTYRFVPDRNFHGTASIRYTIGDGELTTGTEAFIEVNPINDPPWIRNVAPVTGPEERVNTIEGLIGNGISGDVDGDPLRLEIVGESNGIDAFVSGSNIKWTANDPVTGEIRFRVVDSHGEHSATASVTVTATAVPRPPVWTNQPLTITSVQVDYNDEDIKLYFRGRFQVNDPDGDWHKLQYSFGSPTGGIWQMHGEGVYSAEIHTYRHSGFTTTAPVTVRVQDDQGFIIERTFTLDFESEYGQWTRISVRGGPMVVKPLILDLDGDGLNLTGIDESEARFDWNGDGEAQRTGWIAGEGDGILAYDHDGDGLVIGADEISFVGYLDGASTDLEGLLAFDTDSDGRLTAADDGWGAFAVWVDDGDALSEQGELKDLEALAIESISLASDGREREVSGNVVHGESVFIRSDGSVGTLADVGFTAEEEVMVVEVPAGGETIPAGTDEPVAGAAPDSGLDAGAADDPGELDGDPGELEFDLASGTDGAARGDDKTGAAMPAEAEGELPMNEPPAAGPDLLAEDPGAAAHDDHRNAPVTDPKREIVNENGAGLDLPDDDEFDRMALADVSTAAAMEPEESLDAVPEATVPIGHESANDDQNWGDDAIAA